MDKSLLRSSTRLYTLLGAWHRHRKDDRKMGYYDQDYERKNPAQKGNRTKSLTAGFIGAILGGLLILFSLPVLSDIGILPGDINVSEDVDNGQANQQTDSNEEGINEMVNVNVETAVTEAVDKASDAVVEVTNIQETSLFDEEGSQAGKGSGVIYKKEDGYAYVVTNFHVVQNASQIEVSLTDGTALEAEPLGYDQLMDLAVLRVKADEIDTVAEFGNSDNLKPGEPVIAIGNPLGNFPGTVTQGIVSSPNRTIPVDLNRDGTPDWQADVIQTDAAINPGNSGGALINIKGQVVGINSMKIAQSAVEGIGFAIPTAVVRPIINDLEEHGEVKRPYMGVVIYSLADVSKYHRQQSLNLPEDIKEGVYVREVADFSPAAAAGLQAFDVIVALDGEKVANPADLRKHLYTKKSIGDNMEVTFYREGEQQTITMELAEQEE
jgi:serine protease Do